MHVGVIVLFCTSLPGLAPALPDSRATPELRAHERVIADSPPADGAPSETTDTRAISSCLQTRGLDVDTCRQHATTESGTEPSRREVETIRDRLDPVPAGEGQ